MELNEEGEFSSAQIFSLLRSKIKNWKGEKKTQPCTEKNSVDHENHTQIVHIFYVFFHVMAEFNNLVEQNN